MPKTAVEVPVSVPMKGGFLAGTVHLPRGRKPARGWPSVLMCHGFTGHRIEAHFLFVKASRAFAAAGLASLRFDFRGSGESSGRFEDMSVLTELADALAAWEFLGAVEGMNPGRRGVLGFSHGGAVASLLSGGLAAEERAPRCCALWSAVADIHEIWRPRLAAARRARRGKRLRFPITVGGHRLGRVFMRDMDAAPRPDQAMGAAGIPTLIVQGTADAAVPVHQAKAFASAVGRRLATLKIMKGLDHTYERPEWEKKVIRMTRDWLRRKL
jgi:alpha-beta hydrolase superfamily lysophospholipase